ncbi:MAG TPA: ribosome maturation factor RimM, partial [Dehalococcoidia bacterium]|nr:ribosome maturation factor RimM [Dehalococcoidia bacterium]
MDDSSSINVGRILGPHGLWGALRIEVYTDVPHRFDVGNTL